MLVTKRKNLTIAYIFLVLLTIVTLFPFLIMVSNATKTSKEISSSISLMPSTHLMENIQAAESLAPVFLGLRNSLFVAVLATTFSIYASTMVAYGFSVFKFKGNKQLFAILLATMMIPGQLSFIGFYQMIRGMGLINSYIPLIIPGIANAGSVFFLKQYADQVVSHEVIESARIDGAGELRIYHKIIMPIMVPAMSTMAIFTFIGSWNNYLTPLMIINKTEKYTLPLMIRYINGVATLQSTSISNAEGAIYAAALISVIPVLIIFLIFSKKIIGGLNAGSVKG